jgi:hypothetical protein
MQVPKQDQDLDPDTGPKKKHSGSTTLQPQWGFNADPDPTIYLNAVPDPDPGSQNNADPDPVPGQILPSLNVGF